MGIRREGRQLALRYIYQIDLGVNFEEKALAQLEQEKSSKKVKTFAKERLLGLYNNRDEIDDILRRHLKTGALRD